MSCSIGVHDATQRDVREESLFERALSSLAGAPLLGPRFRHITLVSRG